MFFNSFYFPYYKETPSREDGVFLYAQKRDIQAFDKLARGLSKKISEKGLHFSFKCAIIS